MTQIKYALDGPINDNGGPKHVELALHGTNVTPANYSFLSDDGNRVVYHVCGRGAILVIAVAPGWGVGINYLPTSLKPTVDSGKVTLVALQPRGTLPSEHPQDKSRMSSKHMAVDIDALRRHLGYPSINVLGHSNGAAIALAYAEQFSSHCKKAVLIETDVIGFEEPKGQFMNELEKRKDDPRYAEAVKAFKRYSEEPPTSDEELTERIQSILSLYFVEPKSGVAEFAKDTGLLTVQIWAKTW